MLQSIFHQKKPLDLLLILSLLRCYYDVIRQWFFYHFTALFLKQRISEVVFHPFERLHFCEHCPDHCLVIHIFEALMECRMHDPISMNPTSPEQKVVGHVGVNDIARHFWFQVSNLTLETDLDQRMTAPALKPYMIVIVVDNLLNGMPRK